MSEYMRDLFAKKRATCGSGPVARAKKLSTQPLALSNV